MKSQFLLLFFLLIQTVATPQIITTEPSLPLHNQPVTITFHADQGNKGLMNYSGNDVYAHTGVITDKSTSNSDWQYVKSEWTINIAACKLVKLSANEYQLTITPDIRSFFGVPAAEKILKIAFVFRNGNGSKTGREAGNADIFTDVYEEGLHVSFLLPAERFSFALSEQVLPVEINATDADSLFLFLDNKLIRKVAAPAFDTTLVATGNTRHQLVTLAKKGIKITGDTAWYLVPGATINAPHAAGLNDGINYPEADSAVLVLFAPGKNNIYLIGDFNDWLPDSIYQLKKDGDRFWTAISGLIPGKEYAFQYLIDETLRIADPYTEKILDPDNDKYIPETVYSGPLSYPVTKTHQIAGVLQPGKETYTWNDADYVPPAAENLVIYELLIRDFVISHDIKDVAEKLDYLQTLGVNAIELMPFSEFEGNSSWGYNPSFYFAPDKYYGSDTDMKDFIQACHNRGIAVIMDVVLNHAYGQNPMVRMYFNSITEKPTPESPWFNEVSPNLTFSWGYDFNHESAATQSFVDRVVEYWLTEYNLDGFRFDFTKGFTNTPGDGSAYDASRIATLKRIYDKIKSVNSDAYMICEHFAQNNEEKELSDYGMLIWGNSNYNYNEATMGYLANSDFSWASYLSRGWDNPHLVSYMESHDEERLMYKNITFGNSLSGYNIKDPVTALQRMELAGAFFLTIPGPKMIWQFGELGYDVSIDFNGRVGEKPIKWNYYENADRKHLYLTWAKILDIRKKYPVFQTDNFTLGVGTNVAIKKIILKHTESDAIVLGNFGLTTESVQPGYTKTGWWYELFTGDSVNVTDVSTSISLTAGEYRLYASKKMESVISDTREISENEGYFYPNPVSDQIYFNPGLQIVSLEIFDMAGHRVMNRSGIENGNMLDVSFLPDGMYLLRIQQRNRLVTVKFMKW